MLRTMKRFLLLFIYSTLNHIPTPLWMVFDFILDILNFWSKQVWHTLYTSKRAQCRRLMHDSVTYDEWAIHAQRLDTLTGADLWRNNFTSKKYDFKLILERLEALRSARLNNDYFRLLKLFRNGGLLRNFGGVADKKLFIKSYVGTKRLIEDYIKELVMCLNFLDKVDLSTLNVTNVHQMKLDFFHDARQALGCTALVLQGGSLFGLCHLGVIKALFFQKLLPRIICGGGVGAVVAALCSSQSNDELAPQLLDIVGHIKRDKQLLYDNGYYGSDPDSIGTMMENVIVKGYSKDVFIFIQYVKKHLGNVTFEEAYLKTGKVLNIVVHPTSPLVPALLNYVTTPNVLISSAIDASIGSGVLTQDTKLWVKDSKGQVSPAEYDPDVEFLKPTTASESGLFMSPYQRVSELFNVNSFVVSLARPYLSPLVVNDLKHEPSHTKHMRHLATMELKHRVDVFDKLGLLLPIVKRLAIDEKTPRSAIEITIVPQLQTKDFTKVIEGSLANVSHWVLTGERSVWPIMGLLRVRCSVEFVLDDIYGTWRFS